jgi:hypothetical protein
MAFVLQHLLIKPTEKIQIPKRTAKAIFNWLISYVRTLERLSKINKIRREK